MTTASSHKLVPEIDLSDASDEQIAKELMESMTTNGFAYLKSARLFEQVDCYAQKVRDFFTRSEQYKDKYSMPDGCYSGWSMLGKESPNPERPGDYRESFNFEVPTALLSSQDIPPELLKSDMVNLIGKFEEVSAKILRLLGIGLKLQDEEYLVKAHHFNRDDNLTALRINYYPSIIDDKRPNGAEIIENQVRCGEHSDYGTVTLLYTDSPGLEILNRTTGEYMEASNAGGIYVNLGDMLQMWSDDILVANKHRVMIPTERKYQTSDRVSIAFFCQPDIDSIIQSLTGAGKYSPIKAVDWLREKFAAAQISTETTTS